MDSKDIDGKISKRRQYGFVEIGAHKRMDRSLQPNRRYYEKGGAKEKKTETTGNCKIAESSLGTCFFR